MEDLEILKEIYLKRLKDPFSTSGVLLPMEVVHDGEVIRVRRVVADIKRRRESGGSWRKEAEALLKVLREVEEGMVERMKASVERDEVERLFKEALQVERAIQDVEALLEGEVLETIHTEDFEDIKRWIEYIKKLKG